MAFNLTVLTGRLTSDPELKTTQSGVSVTSFNLAVDRGYGDNRQTDFIPIVAWRKTAELITKHFRKGSLIGIKGNIQTRKYQDKNGNNRTAFEVVVDDVQFLESKRDRNVDVEASQPPQGFSNNSDFEDLGEAEQDDLPF